MARDDFKPKKGGGGNMLLSPRLLGVIAELAARAGIDMDAAQFDKIERGGKIHYRLRQNPAAESRPGGTGGTAGEVGAFFTLYQDSGGDTYLQCGTVTGGNGGSESIADEKVLDATTGVGTNSGKILCLTVTCTATIDSGIMLPGCEVTAAVIGPVTSVPANHTFTVAAASGDLHLEIGRWNDTEFLPAGPPGNVHAAGCIGNFALSRI
jgi:hypothetical protein